MTTRYRYPIDLEQYAADDWVVQFPDVPEAITGGDSRDDALARAADALEEALAGHILDRTPVPAPSPARGRPTASPGALIAAKLALYEATTAAGLTNVALAARLAVDEAEVRRMLDPRHATKITRLEQALASLGRRLVVTVEDVA